MANKKKAIYADDLFRALIDDINISGANLARIKRHIENAPAVDAVEVVRCKDCISGHKQIYGVLFRCNVMGCGGLKPDDFCSYGERKDNG